MASSMSAMHSSMAAAMTGAISSRRPKRKSSIASARSSLQTGLSRIFAAMMPAAGQPLGAFRAPQICCTQW